MSAPTPQTLIGSIQFGPSGEPIGVSVPVLHVPPSKSETCVRRVPDSRFLAVHLTPGIWAYLNLDEAVALRAQLDTQIAALSEGFA